MSQTITRATTRTLLPTLPKTTLTPTKPFSSTLKTSGCKEKLVQWVREGLKSETPCLRKALALALIFFSALLLVSILGAPLFFSFAKEFNRQEREDAASEAAKKSTRVSQNTFPSSSSKKPSLPSLLPPLPIRLEEPASERVASAAFHEDYIQLEKDVLRQKEELMHLSLELAAVGETSKTEQENLLLRLSALQKAHDALSDELVEARKWAFPQEKREATVAKFQEQNKTIAELRARIALLEPHYTSPERRKKIQELFENQSIEIAELRKQVADLQGGPSEPSVDLSTTAPGSRRVPPGHRHVRSASQSSTFEYTRGLGGKSFVQAALGHYEGVISSATASARASMTPSALLTKIDQLEGLLAKERAAGAALQEKNRTLEGNLKKEQAHNADLLTQIKKLSSAVDEVTTINTTLISALEESSSQMSAQAGESMSAATV